MKKNSLEINEIIIYIIGLFLLIFAARIPILMGVFSGYALGVAAVKVLGTKDTERKETLEAVEKPAELPSTPEEQEIKRIGNEYSVFFTKDFLGPSARTSSEQLFRFEEKYSKIVEILGEKFEKTELTYSKFLGTINLVYNSLIDNYNEIRDKLNALSDIDVTRIDERIVEIKNLAILKEETINELNTLKERKLMAQESLSEINRIISLNEEVITDLDKLRIKVSDLKTKDNRAILDLDYSRAELDRLIKRVHIYSK